ncbi:MAG: ATP-binding cassette domain-containing protein, partial [Zetaproteobacteria bacterium]
MLRVEGLRKGFPTPQGRLEVLRGLSCRVAGGEFVAVVGESGSGKSTLLQVLGTLEPPDAGEAFLEGTALFALSPSEQARFRNRMLGFVYQAHHLIPELTALENVMLPLQIRGAM